VPSVTADGANVRGDVFLNNGVSAEGEVRLLGAQIGGSLECGGSAFKNPGGDALSADRANVKGSVFLNDGFSAEGEVRLLGAQIGGDVDCSGGKFSRVRVQRAAIAGGLFWRGVEVAETTTPDLTNASAGSLFDDAKSWPRSLSEIDFGFRLEGAGFSSKSRFVSIDS
jgi:hypothetical protein